MTERDLTQPQHEVQRLLGRCLLRIQQYEKLAKLVLARHKLSVSPDHDIQELRRAQTQTTVKDTLGTLTSKLRESYIVRNDDQPVGMDSRNIPIAGLVSIKHSISMSTEDYEHTRITHEYLVDMRNNLVHHFIEHYDVWTVEGCIAAQSYLQECYVRIDEHVEQLRSWAKGIAETSQYMSTLVQGLAFSDLILNGVAPDGSVIWPGTGIVQALRESATQLGHDGWTRLDKARDWITARYAEQAPVKYGCRTWPQVLSESRLFELKYHIDDATGQRVLWFKERIPKAVKPTQR